MPPEPKPQLNSWTLYSILIGNEYSFHTFKSPSENCVTGKTATAYKMGIFAIMFLQNTWLRLNGHQFRNKPDHSH